MIIPDHMSITLHTGDEGEQKLAFVRAVLPELLYGLPAVWLNTSERRRLNGFQNRCLREIWGIKPAFISRVSNVRVLATTQQHQLTRNLEKQQLLLYGKVAR